MTEPQKPDHDDDCGGLDYPTGQPIIITDAPFRRGFLKGYEISRLHERLAGRSIGRAKWWMGYAYGCLTAAAAASIAQHMPPF